jgi:hypothetical protein
VACHGTQALEKAAEARTEEVRAHAAAVVLALVLVTVPVPVLGVVTVVASVPGIVPGIVLVPVVATFEATEVTLELVRSMRPVVETVARHDRDLAIEMRRATFSVPRSVAEGKERAGKDRWLHDRVAAGSAARGGEHPPGRRRGYIGEGRRPSSPTGWDALSPHASAPIASEDGARPIAVSPDARSLRWDEEDRARLDSRRGVALQ